VRRGATPSFGTPGEEGRGPRARRRAGWAAAACAALALSGAACSGGHSGDNLGERARQYLALKQKRDWASIYDGLLDPEARKTLAREEFLKHRKSTFDVLGYSLLSTQLDDGQGQAKVVARIDANIVVLSPRGGTTMLRKELDDTQEWVRRDGRWYIQLEG